MEENPMEENSNVSEPSVQPQVNATNTKQADKPAGICIAALVVGIVSLALWCFWFVSVPCAVIGLVLGIIGLKKSGRAMAITGIVTGAVALVIWAIVFVYTFVFVGAFANASNNISSSLSDYMDDLQHYSSSYYNY